MRTETMKAADRADTTSSVASPSPPVILPAARTVGTASASVSEETRKRATFAAAAPGTVWCPGRVRGWGERSDDPGGVDGEEQELTGTHSSRAGGPKRRRVQDVDTDMEEGADADEDRPGI